jgi:hypothetical protein
MAEFYAVSPIPEIVPASPARETACQAAGVRKEPGR